VRKVVRSYVQYHFAQERPVDLGSTREIARLIIPTLVRVYDLKIGDTLVLTRSLREFVLSTILARHP
jgi:hypothetical protein